MSKILVIDELPSAFRLTDVVVVEAGCEERARLEGQHSLLTRGGESFGVTVTETFVPGERRYTTSSIIQSTRERLHS